MRFKLSDVSSMETEHFQAPIRVIILGNNEIESYQIERPSIVELSASLLSKLHVVGQLKYRVKMIIQAERFREPSSKHCKTPVLEEKNLAGFFFGLPSWKFVGKVLLFSLLEKNLNFYVIFRKKIDVFKFDLLFYVNIFSVPFGKFRC